MRNNKENTENKNNRRSGMINLEEQNLREVSGGTGSTPDPDQEADKTKPDDILLPEI